MTNHIYFVLSKRAITKILKKKQTRRTRAAGEKHSPPKMQETTKGRKVQEGSWRRQGDERHSSKGHDISAGTWCSWKV